jgi:hypothetical protein
LPNGVVEGRDFLTERPTDGDGPRVEPICAQLPVCRSGVRTAPDKVICVLSAGGSAQFINARLCRVCRA